MKPERAKLLHIILVGQPELRDILAKPELAQLDQRVTLRWHLGPLNAKETAAYVRHRLRIAGDGRETALFSPAALRRVYRFSLGIPRLINILCHRALLVGYTREEAIIRPKVIRQAIWELRRHTTKGSHWRWSPVTVSTALVIGGLLLAWGTFDIPSAWNRLDVNQQARLRLDDAQPDAARLDDVNPLLEKPEPPIADNESDDGVITDLQERPVPQEAESASAETEDADVQAVDTLGVAAAPQEFFHALDQDEMLASAVRATQALIAAWNVAPLKKSEWQDGNIDLTTIAATRGLEYLPVQNDLQLLARLDLPVMVGLAVPPSEQTRFILVRQMTDTHCLVQLEQDYTVPLEAITHHWFREAYVFWKNYEEIGITLREGSRGTSVAKLQALLSDVEGPAQLATLLGKPTGFFGTQTQEAVARFQTMQHLVSDGIVGPQTLIVIYNRLSAYTPPSLSRGEILVNPFAAQRATHAQGNTSLPRVEQAEQVEQVERDA